MIVSKQRVVQACAKAAFQSLQVYSEAVGDSCFSWEEACREGIDKTLYQNVEGLLLNGITPEKLYEQNRSPEETPYLSLPLERRIKDMLYVSSVSSLLNVFQALKWLDEESGYAWYRHSSDVTDVHAWRRAFEPGDTAVCGVTLPEGGAKKEHQPTQFCLECYIKLISQDKDYGLFKALVAGGL